MQALERRELEVQDAQAHAAGAELLLAQAKVDSTAALGALRDQLSSAHDADRALLVREMGELQARIAAVRSMAAKGARCVCYNSQLLMCKLLLQVIHHSMS